MSTGASRYPDPEFRRILEAAGGWPERADAIERRDAEALADVRCGDCWWFAPVGGCRNNAIRKTDPSADNRTACDRRAYDCIEFDPITFEPEPDDEPDDDPDEAIDRRLRNGY